MYRGEFLRKASLVAAATPIAGVPLLPTVAEAAPPDRILRIGESYLGTPYRKMNCSEFTRAVYSQALGIWMPADYVAQRQYGWKPQRKRRGDLMLWDGHVGIYYGQGQVLHNSSYWGEVVITDAKYLTKGYRGARRLRP